MSGNNSNPNNQKPKIVELCNLAFLYEVGVDRPIDIKKALELWREAAALGSELAKEKIEQIAKKAIVVVPSAATRESIVLPKTGSKGKILLVDDEEAIVECLQDLLEQEGYTVVTAHSGEEALKVAMNNPDIRLISTDLSMPGGTGIQFLKIVRKMRIIDDAKIIVLTAFASRDAILEGKSLRIDTWFVKPIDNESFLENIVRLLGRKSNVA